MVFQCLGTKERGRRTFCGPAVRKGRSAARWWEDSVKGKTGRLDIGLNALAQKKSSTSRSGARRAGATEKNSPTNGEGGGGGKKRGRDGPAERLRKRGRPALRRDLRQAKEKGKVVLLRELERKSAVCFWVLERKGSLSDLLGKERDCGKTKEEKHQPSIEEKERKGRGTSTSKKREAATLARKKVRAHGEGKNLLTSCHEEKEGPLSEIHWGNPQLVCRGINREGESPSRRRGERKKEGSRLPSGRKIVCLALAKSRTIRKDLRRASTATRREEKMKSCASKRILIEHERKTIENKERKGDSTTAAHRRKGGKRKEEGKKTLQVRRRGRGDIFYQEKMVWEKKNDNSSPDLEGKEKRPFRDILQAEERDYLANEGLELKQRKKGAAPGIRIGGRSKKGGRKKR